ncbi:Rab family GTPase [Lentinula edodes]|uniref:Rab family GTPase n=1 Tax=Lentinula edodes TaxID=5353 RepID=A0A1Q3ECX4_LENED|nr:Rab family GTPase [Lentinula edodes]
MSKDTLMRSALDAYAKKVGKECHTIRFRWAGVWISNSDTPGTLNMEDSEIVNAINRYVKKPSQSESSSNYTTPSMDSSRSRDPSLSLSDLEREEEKEKQVAEEQKKVFEARMNNMKKKKKERAEEKEKLRKEAEEMVKARKSAEEKARKRAEEKVRKQAEEKARKEAAEKARKKAEDKARKLAEDKARKQTENKARKEKAQELAAEQAQREEEDKAQKCAAEKAQREAKLEESKRRIAEDWKRVELEKRLPRGDGKAKQESQDVKSKGDELARDKQRERQASSIWGTFHDRFSLPDKTLNGLYEINSIILIETTEDDQSPTPPEIVGVKRKRSESSVNSTVKDTESDNYDELADEDNNPGAHSPVARRRIEETPSGTL